jgi:hypothetical protein
MGITLVLAAQKTQSLLITYANPLMLFREVLLFAERIIEQYDLDYTCRQNSGLLKVEAGGTSDSNTAL